MPEIVLSMEAIQHIQAATEAINKWTLQALRDDPKVPDRPVKTQVHILDCVLESERVVFLVEKGHLGIAIGRDSINLKRLKERFSKEVKFLEMDEDKTTFVKNVFKPYVPESVIVEQKGSEGKWAATVTLKPDDKGKAIGKGGKNINLVRTLVKRHHQIEEVKVV